MIRWVDKWRKQRPLDRRIDWLSAEKEDRIWFVVEILLALMRNRTRLYSVEINYSQKSTRILQRPQVLWLQTLLLHEKLKRGIVLTVHLLVQAAVSILTVVLRLEHFLTLQKSKNPSSLQLQLLKRAARFSIPQFSLLHCSLLPHWTTLLHSVYCRILFRRHYSLLWRWS